MNSFKCNSVFVIIKQSLHENTSLSHTQYRQPTVKQQDRHQDSQQESDQLTHFIFNETYFKYQCFNPWKTTHACNTHDEFPLKCWSPSNARQHWPEHVQRVYFILKNHCCTCWNSTLILLICYKSAMAEENVNHKNMLM